MMTAPPDPAVSSGPLCKVCEKPMRDHTYYQQKNCLKEAKKRGVDLC